jgi:hypothetical protein
MAKYRKKPVVIEAVRFTGNVTELIEFVGYNNVYVGNGGNPYIVTLEGDMKVSFGDFIIKGVNGEFYPCKPDIFEKTYEEVIA